MIIFNITTHVEDEIRSAWLTWMKEEHIPEILATGRFTEARFCRILAEAQGGTTFSVQLVAPNREQLEQYYAEDQARHTQAGLDRFGDKILAFRTELELISQH